MRECFVSILILALIYCAGCSEQKEDVLKCGVGIIKTKSFTPSRVVTEEGQILVSVDPPIYMPTHNERTIPASFYIVVGFCGEYYRVKVNKAVFDKAVEGQNIALKYTGERINIKAIELMNVNEKEVIK